ncbi:DNA-directed RNA polymerase sigma-70 factor [Cohnella xylanilytica]|uniref:RNA polymerase sigma factor n=1 Tax=Cohnella xylanilytica TaxID=557555 RepID=UPI001AFECF26|nr:sigma-70 family RNA polymerase sigma factor [Cohnella xylanilytica]GIO14749.1 DNA-directed RNA polymerase sigma-70 factor [Cohnella xylanilytica]
MASHSTPGAGADAEWAEVYRRHADLVYRQCYLYLRNPVDAQDAVQSVFLKLIRSRMTFKDREHERAWLLVTTRNHCKDVLKSGWRTRRAHLEALPDVADWTGEEPSDKVLSRLLALPEKYKTVLYLYYYEEYSVRDIAELLGVNESTIQTRLARGRKRLKIDLEGNFHDQGPH